MRPWSKMPSWWFRPGKEALIGLKGGHQAGESQAALRVYLGLAAAERSNPTSFDVQASITDLEGLTQLSRVMVLRGINRAVYAGLITYAPGGPKAKSTFQLVDPNEGSGGWAKMPTREVRERVPRLPHRGANALVALKLYLILLAGRSNTNTVVALKHTTMRDKSGAQPNQIRTGISLLADAGLIHAIKETTDVEHHVQRYQIIGRLEAPRNWAEAVPKNLGPT